MNEAVRRQNVNDTEVVIGRNLQHRFERGLYCLPQFGEPQLVIASFMDVDFRCRHTTLSLWLQESGRLPRHTWPPLPKDARSTRSPPGRLPPQLDRRDC